MSYPFDYSKKDLLSVPYSVMEGCMGLEPTKSSAWKADAIANYANTPYNPSFKPFVRLPLAL